MVVPILPELAQGCSKPSLPKDTNTIDTDMSITNMSHSNSIISTMPNTDMSTTNKPITNMPNMSAKNLFNLSTNLLYIAKSNPTGIVPTVPK
ncbi:hypothetical protein MSG28_014947 [Choristoneura fumiferana]|uniref:Uncharacterized protein n=1 Tax=Choristoneura fumiferana TaxID=7141 RepID=A0ACC0KXP0_CHOFU|nr:hypothetical protein MSG28_014947 [Choristoneura fumiferana]